MKACSKCHAVKPDEAFIKNSGNKSGLHSHCRECVAAASRAWYVANRERKLRLNREWAAKNPEAVAAAMHRYCRKNAAARRARTKAWVAANPERNSARKRQYNQENREAIREYEREYRKRRPDIARMKDSKKRARKAAAFIEHVDVVVLFKRDRGCCGICGGRVKRSERSIDHIVPLASGGEHSYKNTQLAHFRCNASKGARRIVGQLRLVG